MDDPHLVQPDGPGTGVGVLVLSGSSGRVERDRARILAGLGATALTYQWFGGDEGPADLCEFPLESFAPAIDRLSRECDQIVLLGVSKSAEAFLAYAAHDPRVEAVVALAPSHVAWANVGPCSDGQLRPCRSSWTLGGQPVPFVPYDDEVEVTTDPPAFLPVYEQSLRTFPGEAEAARIPVERIFGDVLLVAGGDDQVWPSTKAAREIEARRTAYRLPTTVVTHADAGHRVIFPGEQVAHGGMRIARGGTENADRELGRLVWPHLERLLGSVR